MDSMTSRASNSPPEVVRWSRRFYGLLLFLWLIAAPGLAALAMAAEPQPWDSFSAGGLPPDPAISQALDGFREQHQARVTQMAGLAFGIGFLFSVPVLVALLLPPTPGTWVYHILVICLGLSGCTLPLAVILLIYWFKPETQAYFGRQTAA
ncbi:MAG: hypothetical protein ACK47B_22160 [Armatimonadota bacterium]